MWCASLPSAVRPCILPAAGSGICHNRHQRAAFGGRCAFRFSLRCAIYEQHVERYVVRPVDRPHSRMLRQVSRFQELPQCSRLIFPAKLLRIHWTLLPDVVVNGEDRIAARLTFLKFEMSLREKSMEIIPCDIPSGKQCAHGAWSNSLRT